jgi:hypothetical protein
MIMPRKKLKILIFLSFFSFHLLHTATPTRLIKGHELLGNFTIKLQIKKQKHVSRENIRLKLIPEEDFSGFGSNITEGFLGLLIGAKKSFFNLPGHNLISLETFFTSLSNPELPLDPETSALIDLFFQGNRTPETLSFFTFEKAYEVTLPNGSPALVLTAKETHPLCTSS